jgi:lipopolysaccharide biosynthesis glycosyltransferase
MRLALAMLTDRRGYRLARYAMASALLTQTEDFDPHLFVKDWDGPDPDDGVVALARRLGKPIHVTRLTDDAFADMQLQTATHITPTAYGKFAALELLSDRYDRALYADTDILFYDPISLNAIDFCGNPIAAVNDLADCNAGDFYHLQVHRPDRIHAHYFNSGLIAFDFKNFDMHAMRATYLANCVLHQSHCPIYVGCKTADQCPFNLTFAGRWTALPLTWNMQTFALHTSAWATASVRHYTGARKFLPVQARRADRRERRFLRRIAAALGDAPPRNWPGMGLVYWANGLRRTRACALALTAVAVIEAEMSIRSAGSTTAR